MSAPHPHLRLVTGVNRLDVFARCLAASACLQPGGLRWSAHFNADSAAQAFNAALEACEGDEWLIWAHQDVVLPPGWERDFARALEQAQTLWPSLAVAGVYGLTADGGAVRRRAGHVLDRGVALREPEPLPCRAHSLDELLVAVRVDSGLRMDPALGHDFYATDLVLQAQERNLEAAVLQAWCEHWSDTPLQPPLAPATARRIAASGRQFERKWAHALPVTTTCFQVSRPGDVAAALAAFG